jgi:hypothetical protein
MTSSSGPGGPGSFDEFLARFFGSGPGGPAGPYGGSTSPG